MPRFVCVCVCVCVCCSYPVHCCLWPRLSHCPPAENDSSPQTAPTWHSWQPLASFCIVSSCHSYVSAGCREPGEIRFSTRTTHTGPHGVATNVTYFCDVGSNYTITCQSDGAWSETPTCPGLFTHQTYIRAV